MDLLALGVIFAIPFLLFFVKDLICKTIGPKIMNACFGKGHWK